MTLKIRIGMGSQVLSGLMKPSEEALSKRKLHIKNLRPVVRDDDLKSIFKPFGEFEDFLMGSGECWITYKNHSDAQAPLKEGSSIDYRALAGCDELDAGLPVGGPGLETALKRLRNAAFRAPSRLHHIVLKLLKQKTCNTILYYIVLQYSIT